MSRILARLAYEQCSDQPDVAGRRASTKVVRRVKWAMVIFACAPFYDVRFLV